MRRLAPSRRVMISDYGRLNITGQGHTGVQASLANKSFLFGHLLCSFQYDGRLLRQKAGRACLYMSQDGYWLASFEVIPTHPKSWLFRGQK